MTRKQNILTLSLMVSSVVLLVLLQFFWLQNSYEKAFFDLKRETSLLFRSMIMEFRMANFRKNAVALPADSTKGFTSRINLPDSSSILFKSDSIFPRHVKSDMVYSKKETREHIQIFISGKDTLTTNTIAGFTQRRHPGIRKYPRSHGNFMVRIVGPDTLNMDSLLYQFNAALLRADITVPFAIRVGKMEIPDDAPDQNPMAAFMFDNSQDYAYRRNFSYGRGDDKDIYKDVEIYKDTLTTDEVRLNAFYRYTAVFRNVRSALLQKITPQILFSLVLTIIITTAFIVTYRNLRAQQKLMVLKNDFISNVTHELKTPVATVSVALEALKNFKALDDPQRTAEYLEIAQRELGRLTLMTDRILKTSVFDDNGTELKVEKTDLNEIVQQVLSSMKLVFENRKSTVDFYPEGSDFVVEGEPGHLTNVLYNLLDNAIKYSGEGSVIIITLKDLSEQLLLTVQDNGIGIPQEYQKKIFEKFFRVPSGDVHNTRGYGLGLSYVASVIKRHHGEIQVESELGKGSTFIISLSRRS